MANTTLFILERLKYKLFEQNIQRIKCTTKFLSNIVKIKQFLSSNYCLKKTLSQNNSFN